MQQSHKLQGGIGAAQSMQQANAYSPWGTALMGGANSLNAYQNQQQQNERFNTLFGRGAPIEDRSFNRDDYFI
jgi:hypothetical protein